MDDILPQIKENKISKANSVFQVILLSIKSIIK